MHLNQIKLSGFKSFLEPTTLSFDTPLTGIVGPNGCGKSNIVDAIRWVIGESSAKQLRGESLSDVIFGGSSTRKPVGKAQVELIFDNSSKRFGGRFSEYHEISIKREITRESGSAYFLNQSACRRRDIMDILLGTGLGPRSYAVIEQGMISHIIAATPEELRAYLEEAAMVSKYKERRKEAESRMVRTQENINRINDLSVEVEEQLKKVKAQAEVAQRYREWKKELHLIQGQIEALEILKLQEKFNQSEKKITEKEILLEKLTAEEIQLETDYEQLTQLSQQENEILSHQQNECYRIQVEVSRLNQTIKEAKQQELRLQESLKQFEHNHTLLTQQLAQDQKQLEQTQSQQAQNEPLLELRKGNLAGSQNELSEIQGAWKAWQQQWDQFNKTSMSTSQSMELKKNHLQYLKQTLDSSQKRYARLQEEKQQIHQDASHPEIEQWQNQLMDLQQKIDQQQIYIQQEESTLENIQQARISVENQMNQIKVKLQSLQAELNSLNALQKLALGEGKRHQTLIDWLKKQEGHSKISYFAQYVQIASEWEKALEVVLQDLLDAVCVENLEAVTQILKLEDGWRLVEYPTVSPTQGLSAEKEKLSHHLISSSPAVEHLLSGIYTAISTPEALALAKKLKPHESVITKEGVWVGACWLKTPNIKDERSGMIARGHQILALEQEIQQQQGLFSEQEKNWKTTSEQQSHLKKKIETSQQEKRSWMDQKTQTQAHLNAKKTYLRQMEEREKRILDEMTELEKQIHQQQADYSETQKNLEFMRAEHEKNQAEEARLQAQKRDHNASFEMAKAAVRNHENQVNQLKSLLESSQKQIHYLEKQILRTQEQLHGIDKQYAWVQPQIQEVQNTLPKLEQERQSYHEKAKENETQLAQLKSKHQETEQAISRLKAQIQEKKSSLEQTRKTLERLRIDHESAHIQLQHHQGQITKLNLDLNVIIEDLPQEATQSKWNEKQAQLSKNIQSLGEVNLAATTEYEELLTRKDYLINQANDLTEALNTLQEAIRKIDQETCAQLKNTFEQVNQNFSTLFSKIFEGGQASLEMTENDWLSTGIVVKAQPKGKRNATIHLLSGGEKALTAIALVFAFFQLNPAPFCILDEVDAPLDDHNIGRFCRLVEEMSNTLQFIFISHSKVTLTMAKQLAGVTMREPGVSRIVSVNIEEAVRMAQA